MELHKEYALKVENSDTGRQVSGGRGTTVGDNSGMGDEDDEDEESGFHQYMLQRSQPTSLKADLDHYMERHTISHLQGQEFDILSWWKTEGRDYPILRRIACDVLAIPITTVASESAFSTGGRVIRPHRSKLDPEIVEALICTQDWVRTERKLGDVPTLLDVMEEYEGTSV
ncbi:Zinc finger BED domain-containing protein DAYSLEEPER [Rhynchospora pubera]|uniref:Zinc finger BED domain-containing protein DAYSLEEPER n=1 Tax=Rhynchospora pubera TaxID=906938 RepID=A0AAV8G4N3_9POAL|nr:Zinc finger BED domain-containing protein DAYSLEEPER [Rhynchospora pubera]